MAVRIICTNKSGDHQNPHSAITHLGWVNEATGAKGKSTREQMYEWLKSNGGTAYVLDEKGKAFLFPRESTSGTKFVQTVSDGVWTNNLLSLGECSL